MTPRASLLDLLELQSSGTDRWTAPTPAEGPPRLFGGQVAAQALRAACLTVEGGLRPHSLHAYFIRPGRPNTTLELRVERMRDGRSFCTRHVTAVQNDQAVFELIASFHIDEDGTVWQPAAAMDVAGPEEIGGVGESPFAAMWATNPFDIRPTASWAERSGLHPCWIRLVEPVGDDQALHACALAFVSDMAVVGSAWAPGARTGIPMGASLDHALWIHRPVDINAWHLFSVEPAVNYGARGLALGNFRTQDGTLVASIAQEGLLRPTSSAPLPAQFAALQARWSNRG